MAKIRPFKALRPTRDKVHLVAARPFYSYKKNVLEAKLEDNPFTFLHIINPEFGEEQTTAPNSDERFELVSQRYAEFIKDGILIQDETPTLYIYRQTKGNRVFTGVIGGASVHEYKSDRIKRHEATLTSREEMFTNYLNIVGYNAEPVLLAHPENEQVDSLLAKAVSVRPEYEFTTTDLITHELWKLSAKESSQLIEAFEKIDDLYIADGHHRSASSVGLYDARNGNPNRFANEDAFLAFIVSESDLEILEFNRLVVGTNGKSEEQILQELGEKFSVNPCDRKKPDREHEFTMCLKGKWYSLTCMKDIIQEDHPVNSLDAEILTQHVLDPILGISDLKCDTNISFWSGKEPLEKIENAIESGNFDIAFVLYPVTIEQVKAVADHGMIMPPKSTWVEPKLRSGLTIYNINE